MRAPAELRFVLMTRRDLRLGLPRLRIEGEVSEIASEMFVSVNTIRTHTRHLYSKLDVHTRAQAVERARELGLLAPSPRRW
jgi:ATP/maltotriose-dependent transcriptional regulator MalT